MCMRAVTCMTTLSSRTCSGDRPGRTWAGRRTGCGRTAMSIWLTEPSRRQPGRARRRYARALAGHVVLVCPARACAHTWLSTGAVTAPRPPALPAGGDGRMSDREYLHLEDGAKLSHQLRVEVGAALAFRCRVRLDRGALHAQPEQACGFWQLCHPGQRHPGDLLKTGGGGIGELRFHVVPRLRGLDVRATPNSCPRAALVANEMASPASRAIRAAADTRSVTVNWYRPVSSLLVAAL